MKCPHCGSDKDNIKVVDSRPTDDGIRRRRECGKCHHRFTTSETINTKRAKIIKRDGRRENFNDRKLQASIEAVFVKRDVPHAKITELIDNIQYHAASTSFPEIKSAVIAHLVMRGLEEIDSIAYVRYASSYRRFRDIGTLDIDRHTEYLPQQSFPFKGQGR